MTILGVLRSADGQGAVQMNDRFGTAIDEVWAALTDPGRLAHWLGEVEGDLRVGGEFRAHFFASDWRGSGRVTACEPPWRLLVETRDAEDRDAGHDHAVEVPLTAEGDGTLLVWEERGLPVDLLSAYGAGIHVHVEDLGSYLAGGGRCDASARFGELHPAYRELAANLN